MKEFDKFTGLVVGALLCLAIPASPSLAMLPSGWDSLDSVDGGTLRPGDPEGGDRGKEGILVPELAASAAGPAAQPDRRDIHGTVPSFTMAPIWGGQWLILDVANLKDVFPLPFSR